MLLGRKSQRNGFSLIELGVVLAIFLILLGLFIGSAVRKVREAATDVQCVNNLKGLTIALHAAHQVNNKLPPLVGPLQGNNPSKTNGTLHFYLLPYLEQEGLYKLSTDEKGNTLVWNKKVWSQPVSVFLCPSDPNPPPKNVYKDGLATTNYPGNWLVFGKGGMTLQKLANMDGASSTMVFTERYQVCNDNPCAWGYPGLYYWMPAFAYYSQGKFQQQPSPDQCDPALPQGLHPQGIHFAMADGSVHKFWKEASPQIWWYLCTPDGGEEVDPDEYD